MEKEIWVDARRHENYEISNLGQIRRKKTGKILKTRPGTNKYIMVTLWTNGKKYTRNIARIVWESFNDCACGLTIDHIDRNKANNTLSNLRCITMDENRKNRTIYRMKNKYNLDDDKKRNIITNLLTGQWTTYRASKETGIPTNYLDIVVKRGTWNKLVNETIGVQ